MPQTAGARNRTLPHRERRQPCRHAPKRPNAGTDAGAPGGNNIILEVFAFSASGQPLGTTRLPENDYAIWTAKLVDIAADGIIVQFLPQWQQAQLNLFSP